MAERNASGADVKALVHAVQRRFGLRLQVGFHSVLAEKAFRLVAEGQARSIAEVTDRLEKASEDDAVVLAMKCTASVGETYFFRHPRQLDALRDVVVEKIAPHKSGPMRSLRIWSAGCSTGEEVYTLTMMFRKALPGFRLQVVGTDMNGKSLELARQGSYRRRSFREPLPDGLTGLEQQGDRWQVSAEVKSFTRFLELNLVHDDLPDPGRGLAGFDIVVCRNVLIYLASDEIPAVIRKLSGCAANRAVLLFAAAEYASGRFLEGFEGKGSGVWLREPVRSLVLPRPVSRPLSPQAEPEPMAATALPPGGREQENAALAEADAAAVSRDSEQLLAEAKKFANEGELKLAQLRVEEALRRRPLWPEASYVLGVVSRAKGDRRRALEEFRQVLFVDRSFAAAELGLGELLVQEGALAEGTRHLERAKRLLSAVPPDANVQGLELKAQVALRLVENALKEVG